MAADRALAERARALVLLAAGAALLAGCGGGGAPTLKVSAAASLKTAFTPYGASFSPARAAFSFAGSDELAAQIRQGVTPDVFASANTRLPAQLYAAGKLERPVDFAANRLVLAVPARGGKVHSLAAAAQPGVKVVGSTGRSNVKMRVCELFGPGLRHSIPGGPLNGSGISKAVAP